MKPIETLRIVMWKDRSPEDWRFRFECPDNNEKTMTCGQGLTERHCREMARRFAETFRRAGVKVEMAEEPDAELLARGDAEYNPHEDPEPACGG